MTTDDIKTSAAPKIGAVNGLRGIAIFMVVMHHLFIPFTPANALHPGEIDSNGLFAAFINHASLGVDIFFVLSGFVLYLPYCMQRRQMASRADLLAFYAHRAWRLLPLYYIVVLVTMGLHAKAPIGSPAWYLELGALLSTLFVFSPHGFLPPSNVVLWSVGVEIWFSAAFPYFVWLIARWRIGIVVAATALLCAAFMYLGKRIPVERVGEFRPFTRGLFGLCYEFLLGMLACHLYVDGLRNAAQRVRHARLLFPGLALMLAAFCFMTLGVPTTLLTIANGMLFTIGFAMLLVGVLSGENPLKWMLQAWPLQVAGCMCYSLYAWHGILMNEMIPPETSSLSETRQLLLPFLGIMLPLAALSYRYIEFGRERDWKTLFLIQGPVPDPRRAVAEETP